MTSQFPNPVLDDRKVVYWHRELPPLDGEILGEHVVEAASDRVSGSIERYGDRWNHCYAALMDQAAGRLMQEVARLGGDYAHVLEEHIDSKRDDVANQSWLHGRFGYVLYRRPGSARARAADTNHRQAAASVPMAPRL